MSAISVLGPLVVMDGTTPLRVPPGRSTELLVRLALEAGTEVRTDLLIEDLWGDEPAERNTVQSKVSMLRRALGESVSITGSRSGYTLDVERSVVDAIVVLDEYEKAAGLLASGLVAEALEVSTAALRRFQGDVLPDAGDAQWAVPYRARLEEARLSLLETRIEGALAIGSPASVIGELEDLVGKHPLRENLWGLLILALYRDQRQAEALAAYRRIRDALDEELGLSPGPRLRELEQMVLNQDAALDAPPRAHEARPSQPGSNLPSLGSALVGRSEDLEALVADLSRFRLVTIAGPAGVGKTRLAIEVARSTARDDAWLVRLDAAGSPSQLPAVMGDALGLNGATEAMITDRLRTSHSLIVLDNCEHLAGDIADLASRLLDQSPGIRFLATSQLPLDLDGERVYALQPLPLAASIELFTQRSSARRRTVEVDLGADAAAVEGVCRALDGLPLAIELAAARTKALSVQEIARRLEDRFGLLSDPSGRRPERHRALSTAISWSYDLLFPDEKRVLCAIACFTDGAPLPAVEFIASALGVPASAAVDALGRLADRSLVTVEIGAEGGVRYRLLDSVRAFALDRLRETSADTKARSAHAEWFGGTAGLTLIDERGPRQSPHLALVRTERANIDSALAWAVTHDPALSIRIVRGFAWSWVILGEAHVAAVRLSSALEAAEGVVGLDDRAVLLSSICWNEAGADLFKAIEAGEAGLVAASASGNPAVIAEARLPLAFALLQSGRVAESIATVEEWRAESGASASLWHLGVSCMLLGYAGLISGSAETASSAAAEGTSLLPLCQDGWLTSHIESIQGQLDLAGGDIDSATRHLALAAQAGRDTGLIATEAFHLVSLGRVQQLAGRREDAVETLRSAVDSARSVGLMRVVSLAQVGLGRLLIQIGEPAAARSTLTEANDWFGASGGGDDAALAECLLVTLDSDEDVDGSSARLSALLDRASQQKNLEVQVLCLDAMALHSIRSGGADAARALIHDADKLAPAVAHRVTPADRFDAERARALLST